MNNQKKKLERKHRFTLVLIFSVITFFMFVVTLVIVSATAYFLVRTGILSVGDAARPSGHHLIFFMAITSAVLGSVIAAFTGKITLKPVNRLIVHMNRLASGDYTARIHFGKPFGETPVMNMISDSFNTMAEELQNTEMLRSDFINNFSHEFKTPIVSIAGFAKLLKRGNLTEQQRAEYLDIIEEESLRLAYMATNVLNLTKVENQTILTDISEYNLSEQIRDCVLLLERSWTNKQLDLKLDFDEYIISANAELLKQVWINLIDNAIKFSPDYGEVEIKISDSEDNYAVSVINIGSEISPENQSKIFNKFYQADESHSSEGNGIGLAIVKRVVDLHKGTVSVESGNNVTEFTVKIPKNQ